MKKRKHIAGPDIAVENLETAEYAGINILTHISSTIENIGTTRWNSYSASIRQ